MDGARGRAALGAGALVTALVAGCGDDAPQVRLPAASLPGSLPTVSLPTTSLPTTSATGAPPASSPRVSASAATTPAPATTTPTPSAPTTTATSSPGGGTADLDGDGQPDTVALAGATLTARLSTTGSVESVALPEDAVGSDVEVLGRSDLDGDGTDEALVRTSRLPAGDVRVVLRLAGSGLELLSTEDGQPLELGFLVGMSGRRSYDCREVDPRTGREVRVLDAERVGEPGPRLTFAGTVTTWSVSGETAVVLSTQRVEDRDTDSPDLELDPSTCEQ